VKEKKKKGSQCSFNVQAENNTRFALLSFTPATLQEPLQIMITMFFILVTVSALNIKEQQHPLHADTLT